jgi:hypothetical protein
LTFLQCSTWCMDLGTIQMWVYWTIIYFVL